MYYPLRKKNVRKNEEKVENQYTKNVDDEKELYRRKIIRDFILISSNTGLRFGECRFLKWHNIEIVKGKNKYPNVHIRVPAEISKVKRDRTAVGMRGDLFKRIKSYSMDTHPSDYIFTDWPTSCGLNWASNHFLHIAI